MGWRSARWSVCLPLLISRCTIHKIPEVLFWHRITRVVPEKGRKIVVVVVLPLLSCFEYIDHWIYPGMSWTGWYVTSKLPIHVWKSDPHLIHCSFASPESTS